MKLLDVAAVLAPPARGPSMKDAIDGGKGFREALGGEDGATAKRGIRSLPREAVAIDERSGGDKADDISLAKDELRLVDAALVDPALIDGKLRMPDDNRAAIQPMKQPRIDWLSIRSVNPADKGEAALAEAEIDPEMIAETPPVTETIAEALIPADSARLATGAASLAATQTAAPRDKSSAERAVAGKTDALLTKTATAGADGKPQVEAERRATGSALLGQGDAFEPAQRAVPRGETNAPAPQVQVVASQQAPAMPAGPAFDTPANTVVAAIAEEAPAIARSIAASQLAVPGHEPMRMLKIQLHPLELGVVTARLRLNGGEMSVDLDVETAEARSKLAADSTEILKALRAIGIDVERVTVTQTNAPQTQAQSQATDRGADRFGGDAQNSERGRDGSNAQSGSGNGNGTFQGERHARGEAARSGVFI